MQLKETTPQEMVSHEDFAPWPKTYTKNFIKKVRQTLQESNAVKWSWLELYCRFGIKETLMTLTLVQTLSWEGANCILMLYQKEWDLFWIQTIIKFPFLLNSISIKRIKNYIFAFWKWKLLYAMMWFCKVIIIITIIIIIIIIRVV